MSTKNVTKHIHTISNDPSVNKITFVLLSAGVNNTRGENIPKSLLPVSNKYLLIDHQIKTIKKAYKNSEIIVVGGFQFYELKKYIQAKYDGGIRLIENLRFEVTTSLESLRLACNACEKSNIVSIHGDCLFNTESIMIPKADTPYLVANKPNKDNKKVGISQINGIVNRLWYGLQREWAEIFYLPSDYFITLCNRVDNYKKYHNVFEMLNDLISEDGVQFEVHGKYSGSRQTIVHRIKKNENINLSLFR